MKLNFPKCKRFLNAPIKDGLDDIFNQLLFAKIVPNCRKLGLLDAGDGWLREKFTEIGVIELEHLEDTGEEYQSFSLDDDETLSAAKS